MNRIINNDNSCRREKRVPPGQYWTRKFPVMTAGRVPKIVQDDWKLQIFGLVEKKSDFGWQEIMSMEAETIIADFHCVTQWTRLNNVWRGLKFNALMELVKPKPEARYVMIHCYGGYTTNLALDVLKDGDVLFAHHLDGSPLESDRGGPLRLVVPKRYGWKSAKWVNGLEFKSEDSPGFWESRGYHMDGDPLKEQRLS